MDAQWPGRPPLATLNQGPTAAGSAPPAQPTSASKPRPQAPLSFTQFHTCWMDKQEAAFKAWLNAVLHPAAADADPQRAHGLASRRLVARLRGLLLQLYSQDQELIRWVDRSLTGNQATPLLTCARC